MKKLILTFIIMLIITSCVSTLPEQAAQITSETPVSTTTHKQTSIPAISITPANTQTPEPKPAVQATYVGNKDTKRFHYDWCSYAKKIKKTYRVKLSSHEAAINDGYVPCRICKP